MRVRGLCWSSGGRAVALILRRTCPSGDAPAGHSRVGFVVSGAGFHLGALFCSLNLVSADRQRGKWHCSALSFLEWEVQAQHSSGSPHRIANNHLSCVPGFCQVPAFTLCPSCLPARWPSTMFYLRHSWVSKPNFRDQGSTDQSWSSGWRSHCAFATCWFVSEKQYNGSEFKVQQKGTEVCCPQLVSLFLC